MIDKDFWNVPEDWNLEKFEDIVTTTSGKPFKSDRFTNEDGGSKTPVIRIRDIHNTTTEAYTDEKFTDKYEVQPGDLLVGMDGDFEAAFWKGPKAALNQRVLKIDSIDGLLIGYLKYWFDIILPAIHDRVPKATVKHLSVNKHLNPSYVPVPPLEEQKLIVEEIETKLGTTDTLSRSVSRITELTQEYEDSYLMFLFQGKQDLDSDVAGNIPSEQDIPDTWELKTVGDVTKSSLYGCNPKTGEDIDGVPYLRISDVHENGGLKYLELPEKAGFDNKEEQEKYTLSEGDFVIARSGASSGQSYVYNTEHGEMVYASYLIRFTLDQNCIIKEYIREYLKSPIYWNQVESAKKGAAQNNINAGDIKSFVIPIPPIDEQKRIVEKLSEIDIERVKRAVGDVENLFQEYRQSVLLHAFKQDSTTDDSSSEMEIARTG